MKNPLFKKTDDPEDKQKPIDRISFALDREVSRIIEDFCYKVRDETDYKISKSEIIIELIKLLPVLNLNLFYLASYKDVLSQFEIIRKKIEKHFNETNNQN